MSVFSEAEFQKWAKDRLVEMGWEYVPGDQLVRAEDDVLMDFYLDPALLRLNPEIAQNPDLVNEVIPRLRGAVMAAHTESLVTANKRMSEILRHGLNVRYAGANKTSQVRLIDFGETDSLSAGEKPSGNRYVVSDEVTISVPGRGARRFDLVLFINGIPVVVIELKTPVDAKKSWFNAAKDFTDTYCYEYPQFFVPNLLMVASEGKEYHFGAVGQPAATWEIWGSTDDAYDLSGFERVKSSLQRQLTPASVLSILRDFTLFLAKQGAVQKRLPRYPQVEAAQAIHDKAVRQRPGGLIWHYQGTGKTLLQAYAAGLILKDPRTSGSTVVCVVDRLELFDQTGDEFKAAGVERFDIAKSKKHLRELLSSDYRGVILTTIQRFDREDKAKPPAVLNERSNIYVLVDEAHRTTEGSYGNDMRAALPHARFFGMTGTPIADRDRNTFTLFGDPDDDGMVMSKYEPERSIADGATVPINIEPRLVQFNLNAEVLDETFEQFLDEQDGQGVGAVLTNEERRFLTKKAADVRTFMSNPQRVDAVCEDIVSHFVDKVDPLGMKAMVVAYDRSMVIAYAKKIRENLEKRGLNYEVEVVMNVTSSKDEPAEFKEYRLEREDEKAIKARFQDFADPVKFVVVTAKLITGFDSPILYAQYLDRPLKRVTLFQAITRPNRNWTHPESGKRKKNGLVIDYVGLGEEIGNALQPNSPDAPRKEMKDISALVEEFRECMKKMAKVFEGIDFNSGDFVTLGEAAERLPPGDKRDEFAKDFIALEAMWDALYPHDDLLAYRPTYKWLARVYQNVSPSTSNYDLLWERLGSKTLALVHEHMGDVEVKKGVAEQVALDAGQIERLKELALFEIEDHEVTDDDADANNVTLDDVFKRIDSKIKRRFETTGEPVYQSLAKRLEKLRQQALERVGDSVEWIKKALELAKTMTEVERLEREGKVVEAERLVDSNIGALSQIVQKYAPEGKPVIVEDLVRDIDKIVTEVRFVGWTVDDSGDKQVRRSIRRVLKSYSLPVKGELFDKTYEYVAENY